jgi:tRNA threonylcarbamoyladenosine biosynthesis protein TsaB
MSAILAIDTSTARGSVALLVDGRLVVDDVFTADRSHSSALFPIIERAKAAASRIDTIAIGLGPGSYAGIRIAIATALGLGLASNATLVGIPSVAALETDATSYIAIGDARRDSFYFTRIEDGICAEGPLLLDEAALRHRIATGLPVLVPAPLAIAPAAVVALPRASKLATLAAAGRGIVARDDLEPLYLREPHITTPKPINRPLESQSIST